MESDPRTETEFLRALRSELARVYHDISNPLAIVAGNLELILELEKAGAPVEELLISLRDAHQAVAGFKAPLQHLMQVRTRIDERLTEFD